MYPVLSFQSSTDIMNLRAELFETFFSLYIRCAPVLPYILAYLSMFECILMQCIHLWPAPKPTVLLGTVALHTVPV